MKVNSLIESKLLSVQVPIEAIQELTDRFELSNSICGSTFYLGMDYTDEDDINFIAEVLHVKGSDIENCTLCITEGSFQYQESESDCSVGTSHGAKDD